MTVHMKDAFIVKVLRQIQPKEDTEASRNYM